MSTGYRNDNTSTLLSPGMKLNDRYEIIEQRGQGAFGTLYKAVDHGLDEPRDVAVKQIHRMVANDKRAMRRIKREVAIARNLGHPNIVRVYELETWRDFTYIVMHYINGLNLSDYLADQKAEKLPLEVVLNCLKDISAGLDYLHDQKPPIIHRDLKPSNLIREEKTGNIIITDFGLAREAKNSISQQSMMDTSGSPPYMAPEIWNNEQPTNQTDIYALGIVVYELISGEPPFRGPDYSRHHREISPKPIPGISDSLNRVIFRSLEKDMNERFKTAGEFLSEFQTEVKEDIRSENISGESQLKSPNFKSGPPPAKLLLPGVCHSCGFKNSEKTKYCKSCGTNLTEECPVCGNEDRVGTPYCGSCGLNIPQFREFDSHKKTAEDFLKANEYEKAIEEFEKALTLRKDENTQKLLKDTEDKYFRLNKLKSDIETALQRGDFDIAETLLKEAQSLNPGDVEFTRQAEGLPKKRAEWDAVPFRKELSTHIESKNLSGAMRAAEEILSIIPNDKSVKETQEKLKEKSAKISDLISHAREELSNKNYAKVIRLAENVFELDSFHGEGQQLKDEAQSNLDKIDNLKMEAETALSERKLDNAEDILNNVLLISPNDEWAIGKLTEVPEMRKVQQLSELKNEMKAQMESRHLQQALDTVEQILDLSPADSDAQTAQQEINGKVTEVQELLSEAKGALSDGSSSYILSCRQGNPLGD